MDLEHLKKLLDEASPAPWRMDDSIRGDVVLWGPAGQFIANSQATPHWLPDADGGPRSVMFDADVRDMRLMEYVRNHGHEIVEEVARLRKELEELRASCTCGDTYLTYEGPQIDCPSHGAVRALQDLRRELQEAREQAVVNLREAEGRRTASLGFFD